MVVKGTTTGTITDAEGRYSIPAPGTGSIIFSFIGFITEEVPMNNRTVIDMTLANDVQSLHEVVVTAGPGDRTKTW